MILHEQIVSECYAQILLPAGKTEYQWVWERDNEQTMAYEEQAATTTATTTESYDTLRVRL